jgi:hypothetical protein
MPEPIDPAPLVHVEPPVDPVTEPGTTRAAESSLADSTRTAALRVLARDGRDLHLQPWQVAYLVATSEGREGVVPLGCGVGKGWLQARLDEAATADGLPQPR